MTLLEFLPRDLHHAGPPNESHAGLYEDTTDRGPGMRGGLVSSVIVAAIIVAFRLHARLIVVKSMGVDDYLILGAMVRWSLMVLNKCSRLGSKQLASCRKEYIG